MIAVTGFLLIVNPAEFRWVHNQKIITDEIACRKAIKELHSPKKKIHFTLKN